MAMSNSIKLKRVAWLSPELKSIPQETVEFILSIGRTNERKIKNTTPPMASNKIGSTNRISKAKRSSTRRQAPRQPSQSRQGWTLRHRQNLQGVWIQES